MLGHLVGFLEEVSSENHLEGQARPEGCERRAPERGQWEPRWGLRAISFNDSPGSPGHHQGWQAAIPRAAGWPVELSAKRGAPCSPSGTKLSHSSKGLSRTIRVFLFAVNVVLLWAWGACGVSAWDPTGDSVRSWLPRGQRAVLRGAGGRRSPSRSLSITPSPHPVSLREHEF